MMRIFIFLLFIFSCFSAQAGSLAESCAMLQVQLSKVPPEQRDEMKEMLRSAGMDKIISDCEKENTSSYVKKMKSGTLYCSSGDLCASYDFSHLSDRKLYESGCSQVASCPGGAKDSCSVRNDKVRGGVGTVNWTIYSYSGVMPPEAKSKNCN